MKHNGCILSFASQRNSELLRAYRNAIRKCNIIRIDEISLITVNTPCSRFWVSEERATAVVSAIYRGYPILDTMNPLKREMFQEIYNRSMAILSEHPDQRLSDIVFHVVNSPAPKFYITPRSAMEYISKIKKGHYKH